VENGSNIDRSSRDRDNSVLENSRKAGNHGETTVNVTAEMALLQEYRVGE